MFKKNKAAKPEETSLKKEERKLLLKYDKPKVLLIDMPEEASDNLLERGYNVSSGSFGNPYKVKKSDSFIPVICNGKLPNVTEQEIIIIDLDSPKIIENPIGEKHTSEGEDDWWASCSQGVIDPRPRLMSYSQERFDRILNHGGLFIIFAKNREFQKLKFGHIYRGGINGHDIHYDNWSFLSCLDTSCVKVEYDSGSEMLSFVEDGPLSLLLDKYINKSFFNCTLEANYNMHEKNFIPLLKNKYDLTVSAAISRTFGKDKQTLILIFPQLIKKSEFISEFFQLLPSLTPHLFPYYEGNLWLHKKEYELPKINELQVKKQEIKQQYDDGIESINKQIEKEKEENKYWYDLIRETGDLLVQAVIKTLRILGFNNVIDVDDESRTNGTDASLREDIQIKDKSPILIVDVKGIADLPSDAESTQAHRHTTMRIKEWDRTDINCLTIINHQRNLPPLERENSKPYRQEILDGASQMDLGLMTTWDLYRLLRSFLINKWNSENVKPLFYKSQRISIIPNNYEYVGNVEQIWPEAKAFSVKIEKLHLENHDKIGIETPIEILEFDIGSLMLNNEVIQKAEIGNEVGIKTSQFPHNIKKGFCVYKIKVK